MYRIVFTAASLATLALARTDLVGCTSTDVSSPAGASIAWYVPGTGETCDFLDCGGGRAPPKYNVPGCPLYTGTETYSPSYLAGWGSATAAPASVTSAYAAQSSSWAETTATPTGYESSSWSSSSSSSFSTSETTAAPVKPSSYSSSSSWSTSAAAIVPTGYSNGTSSSGSSNGTVSASSSPSAPISANDAGAARVWLGGAAIAAFGAAVIAL